MILDNEIYCCHASPISDTVYLLESLQKDYVTVKEEKGLSKG